MLPSTPVCKGSLEVICGPMFSGKSEELIRRLRRAKIAKLKVIAFKHSLDNERTDTEYISSHNGTTITAISTEQIAYISSESFKEQIEVVGIDEIQFFSSHIISLIISLIDKGKRVIVAGLDLDHRGAPFGPIATLLAIADDVTKLKAICSLCSKDAHFSQRLAKVEANSIIKIGGQESYQARCRNCHYTTEQPYTYEQAKD